MNSPTSTIAVRNARPTDLAFVHDGELAYILAIEPDQEVAWKRAISSHLRQWTADLERMFVVEVEGAAAGYYFWETHKDCAVLASIHVLFEQRRRGLGRLLLDHYMNDAKSQGYSRLIANVHMRNPARALYEAAGFQLVGRNTTYLDFEYIHAS